MNKRNIARKHLQFMKDLYEIGHTYATIQKKLWSTHRVDITVRYIKLTLNEGGVPTRSQSKQIRMNKKLNSDKRFELRSRA